MFVCGKLSPAIFFEVAGRAKFKSPNHSALKHSVLMNKSPKPDKQTATYPKSLNKSKPLTRKKPPRLVYSGGGFFYFSLSVTYQ